ncbi:MAG: flotillin-like FloA family protein [Clostridia bacterium]|nr:flotillin-like FloA family protein [Clostridia bacterium]
MSINLLLKFGTGSIVTVSIFGALLIAFVVYLCFVPMKSWFTALFGGAYIPTFKLISMKNRKLDVVEVTNAYVLVKKSKFGVKLSEIESLVQNGVNVAEVLKAMKLAADAEIKLPFSLASAIELANGNVVEAVQNAINSKVIVVGDIRAFTQDEREIIASAKVSVKLNLAKYVEGLGEEDLKSTVNAWLLENISHTARYKDVLIDPNKILLGNLDLRVIGQKSMYNVEDIAISKIEIGRDLKLEKEIQLAEKEKAYAAVEAEKRKHLEEIKELQMRTKTEAKKASMLEAEAEVPKALSQAIQEGRFSVMDYYKLLNLQADTAMRRSIISTEKKDSDPFGDDDVGDLFE